MGEYNVDKYIQYIPNNIRKKDYFWFSKRLAETKKHFKNFAMEKNLTHADAQGAEANHTKGEWKVNLSTPSKFLIYAETGSKTLARIECDRFTDEEEAEANAQRIVKAVNIYDELIELANCILLESELREKAGLQSITKTLRSKAIELLKKAEQK